MAIFVKIIGFVHKNGHILLNDGPIFLETTFGQLATSAFWL